MNAAQRFLNLATLFLIVIPPLSPTASQAQLQFESALSCTTTSVGRIPINDLASGFYQGHQGGLYPGGINQAPSGHLTGGMSMAALVQPRDTLGNIDLTNGKIVLLSIGMSNATQEFSMFKSIADTLGSKSPRLVIVDGAQGGQTASVISNPNANFWTVIDQRLRGANVRRPQVQAAWVKEANANPTQAFPRHAEILDSQFVLIARILKTFYPNITLAYWSSRTYGGYATTTLNPEPYAYESGFAVKWTITRQINGDTALAYASPNARSPWLGWGAYLWADGLIPRSDGLIWECDDFVTTDRTHPSTSGRLKVATMLLNFFKTDTTTKGWFLRSTPSGISIPQSVFPDRFALEQNHPNPFNPETRIRFQVADYGLVSLRVYDVLGREVATLVNEEMMPGQYDKTFDGTGLATGVYIYRLQADAFVESKKLLLLR